MTGIIRISLKRMDMSMYHKPIKDVIVQLESDESRGLESRKVQEKAQKYGENRLREGKKRTLAERFLMQLKDTMILILIAAAIISFVVALSTGEKEEFFEPVLILAIVILNAVLGVSQESKAEKAMEALKKMSAPHARVIRDGVEKVVDAYTLVPGDIIRIEAGDFIPADARLLESASLKSDESALTGESVPAEKDAGALVQEAAPLGDRINMVYSGCSVVYGRAKAVVTATGMDTEMGKIASLLEGAGQALTPLQMKLKSLGKLLGFVALGICAVIFLIGILSGMPIMEIFMIAVSLAVSAIPEGLPAIVTIVLSMGMLRLSKKNAVIRQLPAVETLGSASVICSDKTGTLTQNRMTVVSAHAFGQKGLEDISDNNSDAIKALLKKAALCCDGSFSVEDGKEVHIGDPTETSIVAAAFRNGMTKESLNAAHPRLFELPFDSDRKLMTTVHKFGDEIISVTKGAFDVIAGRLAGELPDGANELVDEMGARALRVLAIAERKLNSVPTAEEAGTLETNLTLIGLVGIIDPPRPEVRDAVKECKTAGIRPVMITGDHVITASAIAKDLGILRDGDRAVTGAELSKMSDDELEKQVEGISVYARVTPEDKIRIVRAWQKKDRIVSMTGDGVNDAPALKAADIGCAMGITGTDVAKSAAAMTLMDDNFTTIVYAVKEGRGIYDNIKKVVGFLLGTNIGEILCVFLSMLLWRETPLMSMQLLLINLATDSLPAVALGVEKVEDDVMTRKPRGKNEGLFAGGYGIQIVLQGALFGLLALIAYYIGKTFIGAGCEDAVKYGQTMAFGVLALSQVFHSFNMRSDKSLFEIGPFGNGKLNLAFAASVLIVALVMFVPFLTYIFGLVRLSVQGYMIMLGLSFVPIPVLEIVKFIRKKVKKNK